MKLTISPIIIFWVAFASSKKKKPATVQNMCPKVPAKIRAKGPQRFDTRSVDIVVESPKKPEARTSPIKISGVSYPLIAISNLSNSPQ